MTSPRNWRQIPSNELQTIVNQHDQQRKAEGIEKLKDMEQAYLEEVKLRLELEVEVERLESSLRFASVVLSTMGQFISWTPQDVYDWLKLSALAGKEAQ